MSNWLKLQSSVCVISLALLPTMLFGIEIEFPAASDLIVSSNAQENEILYIANPQDGTIYVVPVPPQADNFQASKATFKVFLRSPQIRHPRALAIDVNAKRLIVANSDPPSIFQVDLGTLSIQKIVEGWPLRVPVSVAVVRGAIVVADAGGGGMYILREGQPPEPNADSLLPRPSKLLAMGSAMGAFDAERGSFLSFRPDERESFHRNDVKLLPRTLTTQLRGPISDFAYQNGLVYATSPGAISIFATDNDSAFIYFNSQIEPGSRIAADRRHIFLLDATATRVTVLPRVVPSTIRFESSLGDAHSGVLQLLLYLQTRQVLPIRPFQVPKGVASAQQLLMVSGVLPDGPPNLVPDLEGDAKSLICKLNNCAPADLQIRPESTLAVPNVVIESLLLTSSVDLAGKSVSDALDERVYSARLRGQITQQYLSQLNSAERSSVRQSTLPPQAHTVTNFELGDIVSLENERSRIGSLPSCGVFVESSRESSPPIRVQDDAALSLLNRATGAHVSWADLKKLGVTHLLLASRDTQRNTIWPASVTQAFQRGTSSTCASTLLGGHNELVAEVFVAPSLDVSFLSDDGPIALTQQQLTRLGLPQMKYLSPYAANVQAQPVPISYRFLRLDDAAHPVWQALEDPTLTTDRTTDIFSARSGRLVLPTEYWQITVLIPATDLYDKSSSLQNITNRIPGMSHPRPLESLPFSAMASVNPTDLTGAMQRRQELLKEIHFDWKHASHITVLRDAYVGVVEDEVDKNHDDFWDQNGKGAWYEMGEGCLLSPTDRSSPAGGPPLAFKTGFDASKDHGTYIAALIAGRSGKLGPGLAPTAGLVQLAPNGDLPSMIADATCRNVNIFNLSLAATNVQGLKDNLVLDSLKQELQTKDALFVVAAGDKGSNLDAAGAVPPPIAWAADLPNIVGVAASEGHSVAKTNASGKTVSNYGRKYVQLVAPGTIVPGAGARNSYVVADGSSPAVPQVAAAAAVLLSEDVTKPLVIKARLMYTADAFTELDTDVWGGGRLNFDRAIWQPKSNLLVTNTSDPDAITLAGLEDTSVEIHGTDDSVGSPRSATTVKVAIKLLLRIVDDFSGAGKRVVYRDKSNKYRVIIHATLRGSFKCASATFWEEAQQAWLPRNECSTEINMDQVKDYIAAAPYAISF